MKRNADVALILWNPDVIQLMSLVLGRRKLISSGLEPSAGTDKITDVIASCGAPVIVFDLAPPYCSSAAVLRDLMNRFPDRSFLMTCADPVLAIRKAPWLAMHMLFQKPYEADDLAQTVCAMARRTLHSFTACSFVM